MCCMEGVHALRVQSQKKNQQAARPSAPTVTRKPPSAMSCARHVSKISSQASSDCVHCWPQPDLRSLVCHLPCTCTLAGSLNV